MKVEIEIRKITSSKTVTVKSERKLQEVDKHRTNIQTILLNTNATPIRRRGGIGFQCCFCSDEFPDPADLKRHNIQSHDDTAKGSFLRRAYLSRMTVKLDITALECTICNSSIDSLDQLIGHLKDAHKKNMYTDIKNQILPFKFEGDILRCVLCSEVFNRFKGLLEHMNSHYQNHVCVDCGAGFVNKLNLSHHRHAHATGSFKCDYCGKEFETLRKKKSHEKSVHIFANLLSKCGYCSMKFNSHVVKEKHLREIHGVKFPVIKCNACDRTFQNKYALTNHTKNYHLMERPYKCTECEMSFYGAAQLDLHMVKHTGQKDFKCDMCHKSFGRKKTLVEHIRIHLNDRRFKCDHCGQKFVQKCSWRGHMRSKHGEAI